MVFARAAHSCAREDLESFWFQLALIFATASKTWVAPSVSVLNSFQIENRWSAQALKLLPQLKTYKVPSPQGQYIEWRSFLPDLKESQVSRQKLPVSVYSA